MTDAAQAKSKTEDVRTFITLADVYHRIGKALYEDAWQDYRITDIYSEIPIVDCSRFLRTEHNLSRQPELRSIQGDELADLPIEKPTAQDREHYDRIMGLFLKDVQGMAYYARSLKGEESECPAPKLWGDNNYRLSTLLSRLTRQNDGTTWYLTFSPRSVKKTLNHYNHISGANKNPKGGMKTRLPWNILDVWLVELFRGAPPPRSYRYVQKIIEDKIRENPTPLNPERLPVDDLIPSESAIKKAVLRLKKEGRL